MAWNSVTQENPPSYFILIRILTHLGRQGLLMLIECQVQAGMEKKSKRGLVIDLKLRIVALSIPVLILIHVLVED